ncbi:hypothetical protein ABV409_11130 [Flagellimonas sp. DF-77]|uniref:hypothetical protein n=1 Tax=Flagellimonas algarum TaxID=3230298 RepID=UPI003398D950
MKKLEKFISTIILSFAVFTVNAQQSVKSLGTLEFSDAGILFAGDNLEGAIHAIDLSAESRKKEGFEINVSHVDARVAAALGTALGNIQINDLAVHPKSGEVYLSVTRGHGLEALPALIKINGEKELKIIDLASVKITTQPLDKIPEIGKQFKARGIMTAPPSIKDIAKAKRPQRMFSIMDMEYHKGELFVAGVSNEEFSSVLRRMPYPFTGKESISNIEMYHIAHDQYESRAPIRAMQIKTIDGVDQIIAAYTCSPLVLIPLSELKDGAKVKARTLGDMGNGQPLDMVAFNLMGQEMLFVTNSGRTPQVIPLKGLNNAKVVTDKDFERGFKLDLGPILPYGPVGEGVMFMGASLQIDVLNEEQFVSLNRDAPTGSLDLETVSTMLPYKMHNIEAAEFDFPSYWSAMEKGN